MRQTDPAAKVRSQNYVELPAETVENILDQAQQLGFKGPVGLSWFNEPLLDPRIPQFVRYAKQKGLGTYLVTNGDPLTPELARELDGILGEVRISIYDYLGDPDGTKSAETHFINLFTKTRVVFMSGIHLTTHFSPRRESLQTLIELHVGSICVKPQVQMIITCTGEMAVCCEDIACNWKLGNINDKSLKQLWYSPEYQKIIEILSQPRSRYTYPLCKICPRPGTWSS